MVWEDDTDTESIRPETLSLSKIFPFSPHNLNRISVSRGLKLADYKAPYLVVFKSLMAESVEVSRRLFDR